ncbi:DUF4363 family protein [Clostridium sp.]|uniref:DUF4363 family protein n=1 Tax=Clostridium sp. TaxID=1506 RepID=UPI002846FCB8|nr:DUF4363 family protein [Clostridium sp.]MDR3595986.1 DUF4363 family protein [Clostridium sp.]
MKNAILSILIFLFTMVCVDILNNSVLALCDNIKMQSEDIELEITAGQNEEAYYKSLQLLNTIQEKNIITSIYLSHQEFDNLINEAVKLSTYLIHDDKTEADASLHLLKYNTEHLKKLQIPSLTNII